MLHKRFEELRYCGTLPSSAGIGLSVLRSTQNDETSARELVQIVRADPALAGKLLHLANIARDSDDAPIGSLEQAARVLSPTAIRGAILSFSLLSARRAGSCGHFDHDAFWSHAIACAAAAEVLAKEFGDVDPEEAYACALIARIGMLALATVHAEAYEQVLATARGASPEQLLLDELRQFDIQHWEVSAAMFTEWGLPERFIGAVLALGLPKRDPELEDPACEPMVRVLRAASIVAHRLLDGVGTQGALGEGWLDLLAPVGGGPFSHDRLVAVSVRIAPIWRATCKRLRLPTAMLGEEEFVTESSAAALVLAQGGAAELPLVETAEEPEGELLLAASELCVLVVDDDPRILRLLEHHLVIGGYRVLTALDGHSALRVVREQVPHVVLTDWIMPGMTGGQFLRALRETENGRHVYGIVLTARDEEEQVVAAFDAGADDFVAKPYNPRVLMARVAAGHRMVELQRRVRADRERRYSQVAEMGMMTRKLHAAAHTDVLTDLPNRRYAMKRLEQEWSDAVRLERPISVLVADVDSFKSLNDRHGHDIGDVVLRSTAGVLRANTRRGDVVCRLGGEEFLVINVNSDEYGAGMCAERLRRSVEENVVRSDSFEGRVTISVGLATRHSGLSSAHELLKAADEAVYAAKAAGRNTVRITGRRISETA